MQCAVSGEERVRKTFWRENACETLTSVVGCYLNMLWLSVWFSDIGMNVRVENLAEYFLSS